MSRIEQGNLIFDGIDAQASGVLISGEGTFDSPERVYEMVEVPGRNGAVAIDQGRFGNIEVTYPAAIWADTQAAFRTKLAAFRSQMASRIGYKRLEDTYHPDEYRLGIFRGAVEVEPDGYNTAGAFELIFDCKPQRFLKSGEEQVDVSSAARRTLTGNPVSFYWTSAAVIHDMTIHCNEMTAGSGSQSPYNPAVMALWADVPISVNGSGTQTQTIELPEKMAAVDIDMLTGAYTSTRGYHVFDGTETLERVVIGQSGWGGQNIYGYRYTWSTWAFSCDFCTRFQVVTGSGLQADLTAKFSQNGAYCILTFRFDAVTSVEDMQQMLADWYAGGNPMIIAGDYQTAETGTVTIPTLTYTADAVNTVYVNEEWTGDSAEIEMDITAIAALVNPTPFEAFPLVQITGTGTVKIGQTTLTISANANPPIYLDCELMEAYQIVDDVVTSANSLITMDNHKFPSLPPGANSIEASSGITGLVVTPKWWRV